MARRLYRSTTENMIGGVCRGLGDYFTIDTTIVRLIAVAAVFATDGAAIFAYLVGWIIIPRNFGQVEAADTESTSTQTMPSSGWLTYLPGLILVGLGVMLLVREYIWWFHFDDLWPIALMVIGVGLIVFRGTSRASKSARHGDQSVTTENGGTS